MRWSNPHPASLRAYDWSSAKKIAEECLNQICKKETK